MPEHDPRDFLHLALTSGIGGVSFRVLLEHFGSPSAVLGASESAIRDVPGFGPKRAAELVRSRGEVDVDGELRRAADCGVRVVPFGSPEYPIGLTYLAAPPSVIFVRGELLPRDAQAMAIVGSRRCSLYGQDQAERFAAGLVGAGFTIVSGLARGIDVHAHVGALRAGGRTIAVLGNGLSRIYPPEHVGHADQIVASGAIISEFPMETGPAPENFPRRNRIIAGLSLGVLVVEAGTRSGATITASDALEQGKDVFAVPGRIDSPFSTGTNKLIQQGAKLVQCLDDILDEFPDLGVASPEGSAKGEQGTLALGPELDTQEEAILAALDAETLTTDQIAQRTGLAASAVSANLTILELKRLVRAEPGQRFTRRRPS